MNVLKEIKKRKSRSMLICVLTFFVLGIGLMALMFNGAMSVFGKKTDIYNATNKKISNADYAKVEIDKYNLYGRFTEEYKSQNNVKTTTAYYCALLVGEESDKRLMAVKVDAKYKSKLQKIEKEYTDLDNGIESDERTVIKVEGTLKKMDGRLYQYFKEFVMDYGYTEDEVPFVTLNLCLEDEGVNGQTLFFLIGVGLVVIAIILLIYMLTTGGIRKIKKQFNGMTQEELERIDNDYMNAVTISKHVKIGRYYTFIMNTGKVLKNDELVWAYISKVQHRTNGIPTGTTYSVIAYDVNQKSLNIPAKNEQMCQAIMDQYAQISDKIILGYDDGYMQLFRTDFKKFLAIAYNRIDNVPSNENSGGMGFDNYFS